MGKDICLVLHRKSANEPYVKEAVRTAKDAGIKLDVRISWNKKAKSRIVKEALKRGATRIVAGGGDGTIGGVVNALVGKGTKPPKAALGVLPLGTANDFAHGLGLPVDDLGACLIRACTAEARPTDVGRAGDRSFINVTSAGFGAEITATTPQDLKKALGGGAYTLMGLVKVWNLKPYRCRLLVPGEEPQEGGMLVMAVGNSNLAGGGFDVAPKAVLDDGLLDLCAIVHREGTPPTQVVAELKDPTNPDNQVVLYRQLAEFTIESELELHYNLDGEPTPATSMRFSVLPRHLGVAY